MSAALRSPPKDATTSRVASYRLYRMRQNLRVVRKRSVVIEGQRTAVSLEDEFYSILLAIAQRQGLSLRQLVASVPVDRHQNRSSALRTYALAHLQSELQAALAGTGGKLPVMAHANGSGTCPQTTPGDSP